MRSSIGSAIVAALIAGCSSGSSGPAAGPGSDTGVPSGNDTAVDTGSADDTTEPDCSEPVDERPVGGVCIHTVSGKVVAQDGTPLPNLILSVCGGVCYFSKTEADGTFHAQVGHYIIPGQFNLLVHGRPDYASSYSKLPAPNADGSIIYPTPIATLKYDQVGDPIPADDAAAATVTAGDVTLKTPDKAEYDLDPEDVLNGDPGRLFRSVKWTSATLPDFVAGSDVAVLYALAPFNMRVCATRPCSDDDTTLLKMAVSIKNTTTLAPGTVVEFFSLGTQLYSAPPTAGKLLVQATGTVSADGKTIDTDPGQGINETSFLGVRVKK
jgi:hypothetical protein